MASPPPILNIVLHQPEIPGNTGAIGRTCVAVGAKLWLVRPLGFRIDEKTVRRAGLDYWEHLEWEVADHWDDLKERLAAQQTATKNKESEPEEQGGRFWYFSRFATRSYTDVKYEPGDVIVFGSETSGLPKSITEPAGDRLLRVPTTDKVRSLNLSTTVGIAAFEAARQFNLADRV